MARVRKNPLTWTLARPSRSGSFPPIWTSANRQYVIAQELTQRATLSRRFTVYEFGYRSRRRRVTVGSLKQAKALASSWAGYVPVFDTK